VTELAIRNYNFKVRRFFIVCHEDLQFAIKITNNFIGFPPSFVGHLRFPDDKSYPELLFRNIFAALTFKKNNMKTKMILLAAILGLQINLSASNPGTPITSISNINSDFFLSLIPTNPREATFEEMTAFGVIDFSDIAPVMPDEADFSDVVPEPAVNVSMLAPVLPSEADFTDTIEDDILDVTLLAPIPPTEADFEDAF
jgi:hypothetical protein